MPWHPTLTELRTILATLYPTVEDARRVVADAGLDALRIGFDAKAINNWQQILEEALRSNQVDALLHAAHNEYPENTDLAHAEQAYRAVEEQTVLLLDRLPFEPETVLIPAGPFWMGSADVSEWPRHEVTLPAYRIGKYPLTNTQYAEFLKQNPQQEEPRKAGWFLRKPPKGREQHPVVGVSWHDAVAYCRWLSQVTGRSYRLPSEAEWEKAARGPEGRRYPWGDDWRDNCANVNSSGTTTVDHFPTGGSSYGCFDLIGNAQEWTSSPWAEGDPQSAYVLRGGSFRSQPGEVCCSSREWIHPDSKVLWRGFRVVLTL